MPDRNRIGFLLVHGFTGSHYEMAPLEVFFKQEGHKVDNIILPGHETSPEALAKTEWTTILEFAQGRLDQLKQECRKCFVCGLSMGGAITHILGAQNSDLAGIIPMASPYTVPDWKALFLKILPFAEHIVGWHENEESGWEDLEAMKGHTHSYDRFHTRSVVQLDKLLREMRRLLPSIAVPVLVMHSKRDETVPYRHSEKILRNLTVQDKTLVWIKRGGHIITEDAGKEQMFETVDRWLKSRI
jgi:carboxylesterase